MAYAVLPALVPDIRKVYGTYFDAFQNEPMGQGMLQILFPDIDVNSDDFRTEHTDATRKAWDAAKTQYTFKCVDTRTGEVVGITLCDIFLNERAEEERERPIAPWLKGEHRTRAENVLIPLWEARERLLGGRPYIYIHVFGVDPKHQGRGAGATMVKWVIDLGEQTRLPIYLESSPTTAGLYAKLGFEKLRDTVVHRAQVLGTESDVVVPLMAKMPSVASMTFEKWRDMGYPAY